MVTIKQWKEYREHVDCQNKRILSWRSHIMGEFFESGIVKHKFLWFTWESYNPNRELPFTPSLVKPTIEGCLDFHMKKHA